MPRSLVLLPTYNERDNLVEVVERLRFATKDDDVDVRIIDDASPDGTGQLAETLARCFPEVSVLHRSAKRGLGRAYEAGMIWAVRRGYEHVVTMDADLSHAPEDVPRLLRGLARADIAIGSRRVEGGGIVGWPLWRHWLSWLAAFYSRFVLRLPVRDTTSGFRAYRVDALKPVLAQSLVSSGFVFQVEILRRILDEPGRRAVERAVLFRNRQRGKSKISWRICVEAILRIALLFFRSRDSRVGPCRSGDQLSVSVVIPIRPHVRAPPATRLRALLKMGACEILVVRGSSPSRQRNFAARRAIGDLILFLDDDSEPRSDLIDRYRAWFASYRGLTLVGGVGECSAGACDSERVRHSVLSESMVMGRSAARYRSRGLARSADERDVILCNLCVRRDDFLSDGGFAEGFYPGEENEFIDRLRKRGRGVVYDPEARVSRRPRPSDTQHLSALFGYGRGRVRQWGLGRTWASCMRMIMVLLFSMFVIATCVSMLWAGARIVGLSAEDGWSQIIAMGAVTAACLWIGFALALIARFSWRLRNLLRACHATALAFASWFAYAAGIVAGCVEGRRFESPASRGAVLSLSTSSVVRRDRRSVRASRPVTPLLLESSDR